jgi:hypothetical protein
MACTAGFKVRGLPAGGQQMLLEELKTYYRELQIGAIAQASGAGLEVQGLVIEGEEVQTIVYRIAEYNPDLPSRP